MLVKPLFILDKTVSKVNSLEISYPNRPALSLEKVTPTVVEAPQANETEILSFEKLNGGL